MRIAQIIIFAFIITALLFINVSGQNNAEVQAVNSAQGAIASLDWAGSLLVVRCFICNNLDEVTFNVDDATAYTKGGKDWSFLQLHTGDVVTVKYRPRQHQWPIAISVDAQI